MDIVTAVCRLRHVAEMRAMERHCLEMAGTCSLPESRAALEEMARNYRAAASERCGRVY